MQKSRNACFFRKPIDNTRNACYNIITEREKTRKGTKIKKEVITMTHRIFKVTENAIINSMDWDEAIENGEIETVEEFDSYEEAVEAFEDRYNDDQIYGVE